MKPPSLSFCPHDRMAQDLMLLQNLQSTTATHCNTLQHTITQCNIPQHCNTLQHTGPNALLQDLIVYALSIPRLYCIVNSNTIQSVNFDRKNHPPPGGFPICYVPSSRTVSTSKRTPLEAPGTNFARGVLLLTVLDEGT